MAPRHAATVRRVTKYYDAIVPLLTKYIEEDIPQSEMAARLNAAGLVNIDRQPYLQPTVSRLIRRMRAAGQLPPDPHA